MKRRDFLKGLAGLTAGFGALAAKPEEAEAAPLDMRNSSRAEVRRVINERAAQGITIVTTTYHKEALKNIREGMMLAYVHDKAPVKALILVSPENSGIRENAFQTYIAADLPSGAETNVFPTYAKTANFYRTTVIGGAVKDIKRYTELPADKITMNDRQPH